MKTTAAVMLALLSLAAGCSSNRSGDRPAAGDADADSDTDSDADTETGSDSDSAPAGWHWMATAVNLAGEFTQIAGRGTDDFLATGFFPSFFASPAFIRYDGTSFTGGTPATASGAGTGVCASSDGGYLMATFDSFSRPRFFSTQDTWTWSEIELPLDVCLAGNWWPAGVFATSGRNLTCLQPEGFAALLTCTVPAQDQQPQMINFYLLVQEGQGWEIHLPLSVPGCSVPYSVLAGGSADDLFMFFSRGETPGYHFNGFELTSITMPPGSWFPEGEAGGGVMAMAGSRASQPTDPGLWVTGIYREDGMDSWRWRGFVWRSPDGLTWTDVPVPFDLPSECDETFLDLWLSEKGEVFVVGHWYCSTPDSEDHWSIPRLLRFDGEEWEEIEIPPHPLSAGETRGQLDRIWGMDGEIFVGASLDLVMSGNAPSILHYQPE